MTARDLAHLRDLVARRQVELAAAAPLPAVADARAEAGRSALAALREAERRSANRRRPTRPDIAELLNPPQPAPRPAVATTSRGRDLTRTLAELAKVAGESARAARIVAALPPLDLIAADVDPVAHVRGILGVAA